MFPCPCVLLLGPTCAWKSEAAERAAAELSAEIVSCDSMQVYRGLDIGTAKPDARSQQCSSYHLLDCLDIDEPYDAHRFVQRAQAALGAIQSRGGRALMVGGTGLYARALVYGYEMLPASPELFAQLTALSEQPGGREELLARLEAAAVASGATIHEEVYRNPRRLVRACEVLALTGRLPWELQKKHAAAPPNVRQLCVLPELSMLKERIRRRTALMLANGWVEEAARLGAAGLMSTPTARQALGYREIIDCLNGKVPGGQEALPELLANRTIRYARRQLTWFRHQHPGAQLLSIDKEEGAVDKIVAALCSLMAEIS